MVMERFLTESDEEMDQKAYFYNDEIVKFDIRNIKYELLNVTTNKADSFCF